MDRGDPVEALLGRLAAADGEVLALLDSWRAAAHADLWRADPRLYRGFAEALVRAGHSARAFDLAREGLTRHDGDRALIYLGAQALVRGRNPEKAWEYLEPLLAGGATDLLQVKAHGLAARIHKDLCHQAADGAERRRHARAAAAAYQAAHGQRPWSFAAINTATMLRVAGERARAEELARSAIELVAGERMAPVTDDGEYWAHATLGEARLLLGDGAGAAAAYREAVRLAGRRWGDVAAMRANVRLLRQVLAVPEEVVGALDLGAVVVFSGHMLDDPRRARRPPRFPADPALLDRVAASIAAELDQLGAIVGYASCACGSDILFGEAMLARGAELHLVLPFDRDDFYRTSVDFGLAELAGWRARCDALLAAGQVHHATREPYLGADALFGFADSFAQGMAINRAAELGLDPVALVVRDPGSPRLMAGTTAFARAWTEQGRPLRSIDLSSLRGATPPGRRRTAAPARRTTARRRTGRDIKAMLFADVKNFSRLPEARAPSFFLTFLAEVDRTIRRSRRRPIFQNTWGDGLYLVFDGVVDCADLALRLLDRLGAVDWEEVGLPADTAVRIGLHCGPVYRGRDPIIGRDSFFGSHVTRAARIEPVTTPGCAFASEQFAAALAAAGDHRFTCDYVGVQPLAKDAGTTALYRLRRSPTIRAGLEDRALLPRPR